MTAPPETFPSSCFRLYIDGEWCDAVEGGTLDIVNPTDESIVKTIPYGSRRDLKRALQAAQAAFDPWRSLTAYDRGAILKRAADLTRERCDEIARLLTLEEGKTIGGAKAEINGTAATLEWYAEEGKRAYGRIVPASFSHKRIWVIKHPVGVVGAITPWNFPVMLQARKIGAALAAGCTTISRPASQTPLATMAWFKCLHDAGFPPGTINLVPGPAGELADELFENPICRKISFTGSTEVGKSLLVRSADQLMKMELELGGHAPVLIFPDVDIEAAAKVCAVGKFRNMGQVCISPTRFYAHEDIQAEFTEAVVETVRALKMGNPLEPETDAGPLFEQRNVEKTEMFVADAVGKGAKVLTGGKRPDGYDRGFWYEPTVLTNISPLMRLTCEEIFGPVMPLLSFQTTEEALAKANATSYGLAAYALTQDLSTAIQCAEGLEYGIIGINDTVPACPQAPFGGMKESGLGRENGVEGLDEYFETKMVSLGL